MSKTSRTRSTTAQQKVAQMRAQAARARARRRSVLISLAVAAVLALVVGTAVLIQAARNEASTAGAAPANVTDGAILVGKPDAPVTITLYEDFQCPVCRSYEQANGAQLKAWVADGTARISYRPIAFLDRASTDRYSTRALNAAAAVVNSAPDAFQAFHDALYAEQPAEGGPGLSNDRLVQLAVQAGAPEGPVRAAVGDLRYAAWAARVTDAASRAGVTGTPTVLVNGTAVTDLGPAALAAAVAKATTP